MEAIFTAYIRCADTYSMLKYLKKPSLYDFVCVYVYKWKSCLNMQVTTTYNQLTNLTQAKLFMSDIVRVTCKPKLLFAFCQYASAMFERVLSVCIVSLLNREYFVAKLFTGNNLRVSRKINQHVLFSTCILAVREWR